MSGDRLFGLTDTQLIVLFRETRDDVYFCELIRRHWRELIGTCRQYGPSDEHEDLAQEVCLKAYTKIDQLAGENFRAWLLTIARNASRNVRPHRWEEDVGDRDIVSNVETIESVLIQDADEKRLLALIDDLPERQRICILLRYFHDVSYEDIARRTGWPLKAIKSYLQNGIRRLGIRFHVKETKYG